MSELLDALFELAEKRRRRRTVKAVADFIDGFTDSAGVAGAAGRGEEIDAIGQRGDLTFDALQRQRMRDSGRQQITDFERLLLNAFQRRPVDVG